MGEGASAVNVQETMTGEVRVNMTRTELEQLLADFYASGYVAKGDDQEFAMVKIRAKKGLSYNSNDEFIHTIEGILERTKEL